MKIVVQMHTMSFKEQVKFFQEQIPNEDDTYKIVDYQYDIVEPQLSDMHRKILAYNLDLVNWRCTNIDQQFRHETSADPNGDYCFKVHKVRKRDPDYYVRIKQNDNNYCTILTYEGPNETLEEVNMNINNYYSYLHSINYVLEYSINLVQ